MMRIIVVDDHRKVHTALEALLITLDDIAIVAHGSSAQEAIDLCRFHQPDIVLMDVMMPGGSGIEATRQILAMYPQIKILALSGFQDKDSIIAMLEAGAVGYILKTASGDEIANTLRAAYDGQSVLSPQVMKTLLQSDEPKKPAPDYQLTRRELEVLKLMVDGLNNSQIAKMLSISVSTARFHVTSILTKLGVSNRVEAVARTVEEGLLSS